MARIKKIVLQNVTFATKWTFEKNTGNVFSTKTWLTNARVFIILIVLSLVTLKPWFLLVSGQSSRSYKLKILQGNRSYT